MPETSRRRRSIRSHSPGGTTVRRRRSVTIPKNGSRWVLKPYLFLRLRAQRHVRGRPCRVVFRDGPDVSAALTVDGPYRCVGGLGVHHSTEAVTVRARTEWRKSVSAYWGAVSLPVLRRLRRALPPTGGPLLRPPSARPGWIWERARRARTLRIGSSGRPRHDSRLQVNGAFGTDRLDRDETALRSPRLWWSPVLVREGKSGEATGLPYRLARRVEQARQRRDQPDKPSAFQQPCTPVQETEDTIQWLALGILRADGRRAL